MKKLLILLFAIATGTQSLHAMQQKNLQGLRKSNSKAYNKMLENSELKKIYESLTDDEEKVEIFTALITIMPNTKQCVKIHSQYYAYNHTKQVFESPAILQLIGLLTEPKISEKELLNQAKSLLENKEIKEKLNTSGCNNHTPLTWATYHGKSSLVELLLTHGAQVNQCNNDGNTPLMIAAFYNQLKITRILLSNGANPHICNSDNINAIQMAKACGNNLVSETLTNHIQKSTHISQSNSSSSSTNRTSMSTSSQESSSSQETKKRTEQSDTFILINDAIEHNDIKALKKLQTRPDYLQHINTPSDFLTPLEWALSKNHLEIAEFLLQTGANPNQTGATGLPLTQAIMLNNVDSVRLLLKYNTNITTKNLGSKNFNLIDTSHILTKNLGAFRQMQCHAKTSDKQLIANAKIIRNLLLKHDEKICKHKQQSTAPIEIKKAVEKKSNSRKKSKKNYKSNTPQTNKSPTAHELAARAAQQKEAKEKKERDEKIEKGCDTFLSLIKPIEQGFNAEKHQEGPEAKNRKIQTLKEQKINEELLGSKAFTTLQSACNEAGHELGIEREQTADEHCKSLLIKNSFKQWQKKFKSNLTQKTEHTNKVLNNTLQTIEQNLAQTTTWQTQNVAPAMRRQTIVRPESRSKQTTIEQTKIDQILSFLDEDDEQAFNLRRMESNFERARLQHAQEMYMLMLYHAQQNKTS